MNWPNLKHFRPEEFRHPEKLLPELLRWLDLVREAAGVPMIPTSDFRTHIPPGGSASSLHLVGRAVDFRWHYSAEARAAIVSAVTSTPTPASEGGFELGLEPGAPGGAHWHVGLFPRGRPSRLFVR
jgi:hypothetical protein